MHAVLIEIDVREVDGEAGARALRERIVPAIQAMTGFVSGTWLPGNAEGLGLSLTVWEREEDAQSMADRFGVGASPAAAASVVRCEMREVAAVA